MPNEDGVPMGEVPDSSVSGRKEEGFQDSSQKCKKTAPMQPQKLAEDIDTQNTKAKEMMANEVGVPQGQVPTGSVSERKQAGFQASSQKHTKTPPMPTHKHGAKKHPANGRFGFKTEWQRRFIPAKNHPTDDSHSKMKRHLKRKHQQANEPSKKKAKIQSSHLPSTSEAIPNFGQKSTPEVPTNGEKQELQKPSCDEPAVGRRAFILGNGIPYFISL